MTEGVQKIMQKAFLIYGVHSTYVSQTRELEDSPNHILLQRLSDATIDIAGGSYGGHDFNGDTNLCLVLYNDNSSACERTYSLSFYDEDHPNYDAVYDAVYDALRCLLFNRTFGIEAFTIKNNNQIIFDNTYSSNNDFDCLDWFHGCHSTFTKTYYPSSTVYVSNTWNHMMNTHDTNPNLRSVSVP